LKLKKSKKSKQPQIGGAAAAAWEHHLTPEKKEELGEEYAAELKRKYDIGKRTVLAIAVLNLLLAHMSIFLGFNIAAFIIQFLLSVILIFVLPGVRVIFITGAALVIFLSQGTWAFNADYGVLPLVFTIVNIAFFVVSAILLLASSNVADYLYTKRYG